MIVCSIDLMEGKAVQLQQGERKMLERDDVIALAEQFGRLGEVAVIDLDAARGVGQNRALIERLCRVARCRVGGGIRDVERARAYLRAGAQKVIIGTAASEELLSQLPPERSIVAIDGRAGKVVTHGWTVTESETPLARAKRLDARCSGFLYTNVEREGMLGGFDLSEARALRASVSGSLTVAGGVRNVDEVVGLDRLGVDAQIGMAIYTGAIDPVEAFVATLDFGKAGGLIPTIVCDAATDRVRMVAYSTRESMIAALRKGDGTYWSRSRQHLWRKGETSGATQRIVRTEVDCDRDAVVFYVEQNGATCHTGAPRCFNGDAFSWADLMDRVDDRARGATSGSYTFRLLNDVALLDEKIREEAEEVTTAKTRDELAWECADLLYFLSVKMQSCGLEIADVMSHLASRALSR